MAVHKLRSTSLYTIEIFDCDENEWRRPSVKGNKNVGMFDRIKIPQRSLAIPRVKYVRVDQVIPRCGLRIKVWSLELMCNRGFCYENGAAKRDSCRSYGASLCFLLCGIDY